MTLMLILAAAWVIVGILFINDDNDKLNQNGNN